MKNKTAFTLIETIIAITLITVVMTAVTGLILTTLLANERNTHALQANFLAQEGLESVRFMRDSNWLQNYTWDSGKVWGQDFNMSDNDSPTLYIVDKPCNGDAPCFSFSALPDEGVIILNNDFEFTRTLSFSPVLASDGVMTLSDTVQVTATVSWLERGEERSTALSTILTDWK